MKTATALTIAAIGAILAFAVTAQPSFFSFHVAGWVLMLTGVAGAVMPRRGYGWVRRRLVFNGAAERRDPQPRPERRYSRMLVRGGIIADANDALPADVADVPVETDVIDQYIEE